MRTSSKNQLHPTPPKKKRVDAQGNARCRVFAKSGNATLGLAKGLTRPAAALLIKSITDNCSKLGGETQCEFVITPKR